jgi:hypothetical protein
MMMRSHWNHLWIIPLLGLGAFACRSDVKVDRTRDTVRVDSAAKRDSITVPGRFIDVTGDTDTDGAHAQAPPASSRNITVTAPVPDEKIRGQGFLLKGTARTFENGVEYRIVLTDGTILAHGHTTSRGEMGRFNPYEVRISWAPSFTGPALLEVFQSSARDGSEIDKVSIPLSIAAGAIDDDIALRIFLTNAAQGTASDCAKVFPVTRRVPRTVAVAEAALRALLEGPTDEERRAGYGSEIPPGTRLRQITITDGRAVADFSAELGHLAGSCGVTAARAEIERTLRQFTTVRSVTITIDGSAKEVLQP